MESHTCDLFRPRPAGYVTHRQIAVPSVQFWVDPPVGHTGMNIVFKIDNIDGI